MTHNRQGVLSPEEIANAQNAINQGTTGGEGSQAMQGFTGMQSGGMVKPGDKVEAQNAMRGMQAGGIVKPGDKIEAESKM